MSATDAVKKYVRNRQACCLSTFLPHQVSGSSPMPMLSRQARLLAQSSHSVPGHWRRRWCNCYSAGSPPCNDLQYLRTLVSSATLARSMLFVITASLTEEGTILFECTHSLESNSSLHKENPPFLQYSLHSHLVINRC